MTYKHLLKEDNKLIKTAHFILKKYEIHSEIITLIKFNWLILVYMRLNSQILNFIAHFNKWQF